MAVDEMIKILKYRGANRDSLAIITAVKDTYIRVIELRDNVVQYRTFQLAHLNYRAAP